MNTALKPLACLLVLLTGCATMSVGALWHYQKSSELAAYLSCSTLLKQKPESVGSLRLVSNGIDIILTDDTFTLEKLRVYLTSLPVSEFRNPDTQIYFTASRILFEDIFGPVEVTNPEVAKAIARGLVTGMQQAIVESEERVVPNIPSLHPLVPGFDIIPNNLDAKYWHYDAAGRPDGKSNIYVYVP